MTNSHCFVLALVLMAVPPVGAYAQEESRRAAIPRLDVGLFVRIDDSQMGQLRGRIIISNDTSLTVASRNGPTQIRILDMQRLWSRGRGTGRGAIIGAGAGVVAGVVYGLLIGEVACNPVDGGDCTTAELALVTGLIGGAGGAAVGAGIGFHIPIWTLRFP